MTRKKPITELRPGDQLRVTGLPPGQDWVGPIMGINLKEGDIITLRDPPVFPVGASAQFTGWTREEFVLRFNRDYLFGVGWLPYEFVEPVNSGTPTICTCNIMITGCICGVFQKEKQSHG